MRRSSSSSGFGQLSPVSTLYSINSPPTPPGKPRVLNCYLFHDSSHRSNIRSPSRTQMQQQNRSEAMSYRSQEMPPTASASGRGRHSKEANNRNMSDSFSSLDFNLRPLELSHEQTTDERTSYGQSLPKNSTYTAKSPTHGIKTVASTPREVRVRTSNATTALHSSTDYPISSNTSGETSGTTSQPEKKSLSLSGVHSRNTGKSFSPGMCWHVGKSTIPGAYCDAGKSTPGLYCNAEKSIPGMYCDAEKSSIRGILCDAGKFQAPRYTESFKVDHLKGKPQRQALRGSVLHSRSQLQDEKSRDCDSDLQQERAFCEATEQPRTSCTQLLSSQKVTDQKKFQSTTGNEDMLIETTVLETLGRRSALALEEEIEISHVRLKQRPFTPTCKHSPNSYNATWNPPYVPGGIANTCSTELGGMYIQSNTTGTVSKSDGKRRIIVPLLIAEEHTPRNKQVNNNRVNQRRAHSVHFDHTSTGQSDATALQPSHTVGQTKHTGSRSTPSNVKPPVASNMIQIENALKGLGYEANLTEDIDRNRCGNVEFISKQHFSTSEPVKQQSRDVTEQQQLCDVVEQQPCDVIELSKTDNGSYSTRKKKRNPTPSNEKDKQSIDLNVIHKTSYIKNKQPADGNRYVWSSEQHKIPGKEVNEPVVEAFILPVQQKRGIPRSLEVILATLTTNDLPYGYPKESMTMSGVSLPTNGLIRPDHESPVAGESCAAKRFSTNLKVQLHTAVPRPQYKGKVSLVGSKAHTAKSNHSSVLKATVQH